MITLDASVMIAYNRPEDAHHRATLRILTASSADALFAHPLSIAEALVGPARVGREEEAWSILAEIGVRPTLPDADEPLRLARLRASTGLRLPDCCVLSAALSSRSGLATFDDRLAGAARALGIEIVSG